MRDQGRGETKKRLRTWSALPSHSTPTVGHVEQSSSYARYAPLEHRKQLPRALSGKPPPRHFEQFIEPAAANVLGGQVVHSCSVPPEESVLLLPIAHGRQ